MNKLKIDTSSNLSTVIELIMQKKRFIYRQSREKPGDQNVLVIIEKVLYKHKIQIKDINEIEINTGPGSFTGLRVGTAIANAFSFSNLIKINGRKIGEIITPEY